MKIAAIRDIIRAATWTRSDLTGGTINEFIRQDVGGRLTAKIEELRALVIAPRFADDIAHRDGEIERCETVIARWNNRRAEAKADQLAKAEEMGRAAYVAGKSSAPASDAVLMQAITVICQDPRDYQPRTVEMLDAWIKGWHTANACAVHEAMPPQRTADVIDFAAARARRMAACTAQTAPTEAKTTAPSGADVALPRWHEENVGMMPGAGLYEHQQEWVKYEDASAAVAALIAQRDAKPAAVPARALAEWHEDDGAALWFAWCGRDWAGEPAWAGTPLDSDWPGYHTHWIPHPTFPSKLESERGEDV